MIKVITYGTFDMLHYGHIRLLERLRELGDYVIVGITTENFDLNRGKISTCQSLMERVQAVKNTGLADEVIVEEYEGQKIDDIRKYNIDIFAIGSDWIGKFDYLNEYCKVIYLERTEGVSSTQLRNKLYSINLGIVGYTSVINKFISESKYVSSFNIKGICISNNEKFEDVNNLLSKNTIEFFTDNYDELLNNVDAIYIFISPNKHYEYVKKALQRNVHVICETPITLSKEETIELYNIASNKNVILFEAIKTGYFVAFSRLISLVKSGIIGDVKSVDVTCTSLETNNYWSLSKKDAGGSVTSWGPYALLVVFKILGILYEDIQFTSYFENENNVDLFTKIDLRYSKAVATIKVGLGVKSEGDLVISGTEGYIYVPSPWWKMDYFEVRYENFNNNKRYFYQLDGEGLRYEQSEFVKCIKEKSNNLFIEKEISIEISQVMERFLYGKDDNRFKI